MPNLRVLRVIPTIDPTVGGPSHSAVNAAIAESGPGISSTLATCFDRSPVAGELQTAARLGAAGVRVLAFPRTRLLGRRGRNWGLSPGLAVWLFRSARKYDIVNLHYVWCLPTIVGALAARLAGVPVVLTGHESLTRYDIDVTSNSSIKRGLKLVIRRLVMRSIDTVICSSELEMEDSLRPGETGVVLPHPIPAEPGLEKRLPAGNTFTIGYLGRLHPKKGLHRLLVALSELDDDFRLIVCGSGDEEFASALRKFSSDLGLDARVEWRGHVGPSGKNELFRTADWVAMPSDYECFGMAGAEALSAGVPVIVSSKTGIAPIVEEFDCGFVVDTTLDGDLTAAMAEARRLGPERTAVLSSNAISASRDRFAFSAYQSHIERIYARILS